VIAGGLLLLVTVTIQDADGQSLLTVSPLILLDVVVAVGLAWSALAATDARTRAWLTAAAVTYAALGVVGSLPIWIDGDSPGRFLVAAAGYVVAGVGVLSRELRLRSRP
jgi:hypothetical protein